jgi:DNA-binding transcriptional LysR family regulator
MICAKIEQMAHFGEQLSGITAFVRSVDLGSFSAAARDLGTSPSAVSKAVAQLEDRYGVLLLRRTTRSLQVTLEGDVLYERGRHILAELDAADSELRESKGPRGTLRVTAPVDLGRHWLTPLLPMFSATHPNVRIELDLSDRILDLDNFDVAIRLGERATPDTVRKKLGPTMATICASSVYLAAHGTPHAPAELRHHNCMHFLRDSGQMWPIGDSLVEVRGSLAISNNDALLSMALAGVGIVRIPDFIAAQHLKAGHLTQLFADLATPSATAYALYPERRHVAPRVRAFVDFVASAFPR